MEKFNKILLVDDDEITNYLNESLITELRLAHRIETLTDAEEALKLIEKECPAHNCPDLILLDLKMPVFDGFDFLEGFKSLPATKVQKTQVVVLTTSSNPKDIERLKALGIDRLVNKPLTKEKMLEIV